MVFGVDGGCTLRFDADSIPWSSHESKQDQWVMQVVYPGRRTPGFFVDTGAADGVSASATFALESHFGWLGICVEPNTLMFERLRANRRSTLVHGCVSDMTGDADFVEASWFGRIRDHAKKSWPDGDHRRDPYLTTDLDGSPSKVTAKPCYTLDDLLRRHGAPRRIDYVNIDAEFSEWQVLKDFPFGDWDVHAMSVDTKFRWQGALVDRPHAAAIRELMIRNGYRLDRKWSAEIEHDLFVKSARTPNAV